VFVCQDRPFLRANRITHPQGYGGYGNLILCDTPDAPVRWHEHRIHARAVELAPRHYHSARLHNGVA